MECCCTELRHTVSNDLFWQPLFQQEFGFVTSYESIQAGRLGWQRVYGLKWADRCVPSAQLHSVYLCNCFSCNPGTLLRVTYPGLEGVLSATCKLGCVWPCKQWLSSPATCMESQSFSALDLLSLTLCKLHQGNLHHLLLACVACLLSLCCLCS